MSSERRYPRIQTIPKGKSMTEQTHKKDCDINTIIKRYNRTGILAQRLSKGVYGDFTNVTDFQTSLNRVRDAQQDFLALPSDLRKRFRNDPGELIEFISDPNNRKEAIALGLIPDDKGLLHDKDYPERNPVPVSEDKKSGENGEPKAA